MGGEHHFRAAEFNKRCRLDPILPGKENARLREKPGGAVKIQMVLRQ